MLRLSEVYRSVQGEGPRVGLPTTFVRFAGCNLRCPGWACDTQHAIDPAMYRHEWRQVEAEKLMDEVIELSAPDSNICLTGGEPFLQPLEDLKEFVGDLVIAGRTVECFSNGTLRIPEWAFRDISFVLDWKLPGSGEGFKILSESLYETNLHTARAVQSQPDVYGVDTVIKFTVADWEDFQIAVERWGRLEEPSPPVFVAPVWGKMDPKELVDWILECDLPWRLNLQMHKYVWPADERGV